MHAYEKERVFGGIELSKDGTRSMSYMICCIYRVEVVNGNRINRGFIAFLTFFFFFSRGIIYHHQIAVLE